MATDHIQSTYDANMAQLNGFLNKGPICRDDDDDDDDEDLSLIHI